MKNYLPLFCFLLLAVSCSRSSEPSPETNPAETIQNEAQKRLRHVVLFAFKETSTDADIMKVEKAFIALPSKIEEIRDFEWGLNNSPEGLNQGFTHCFLVTFDSEEDRAKYLPHPAHMEFVEILTPHLEDVLVVDYWAQ